MNTFYWYDLETFGTQTKYDRIAQFAGIRTDENLQPLGEPDMFYCQPTLDYLPDPGSCLVTGITPQHCQQHGLAEHAFAARVHQILSEEHTCGVGYNSIRFDDECVRSLFYRNLYDPYQREYLNGNSRWDLIDVVRATHALRPEGIQWPLHDSGKPSFRLEDLSKANNLTHRAAHDALSDVEATIELARMIKQQQPKLFEYALSLRSKDAVRNLLNWQVPRPIVHVSSKIPAERGCLSLMLPLAIHPHNKNGVICYDLFHDPADLISLDVADIQDRLYTPLADLPEGVERVHLKTIHLNKSPFVAPLSVLKGVDLERIGMDYERCKTHWQSLQQQAGLEKKASAVFDQPFDANSDDVDEMIYGGFFSFKERARLEAIRQLPGQDIPWQADDFEDPRAATLLQRYRARNYPESLSPEQQQQWQADVDHRLTARFGEDFSLWFDHLNQLRETTDRQDILDQVEQFVMEQQGCL
ncbi:exodeoxyribonuclease I [Marinicella sediminis]|uniref:Exodeoxyribonuclease I n=1 Tax=Marinicella sediminis TaxID=1792834 RepID=A0ABV7J7D7_9GAMM|nr:exodeoxyribonuclease I [Marinicella sediminis]